MAPKSAAGPHVSSPPVLPHHWVTPCPGIIAHAVPESQVTPECLWTLCRLVHEFVGGEVRIEQQHGPVGEPYHMSVRFVRTLVHHSLRLGITKSPYKGASELLRRLGPRIYFQGLPLDERVIRHCRYGDNIYAMLNGLHWLIVSRFSDPWPGPISQHVLDAQPFRTPFPAVFSPEASSSRPGSRERVDPSDWELVRTETADTDIEDTDDAGGPAEP